MVSTPARSEALHLSKRVKRTNCCDKSCVKMIHHSFCKINNTIGDKLLFIKKSEETPGFIIATSYR